MKHSPALDRILRLQRFFTELKRRRVPQTIGVYLVAVWGFSAGAADIFDVMDIPQHTSRYVILFLFALTPLVALLSWLYEITLTGVHREKKPVLGTATDAQTSVGIPSALNATYEGRTHSFSKSFVVGRDDSCELQIVDPQVSRRHVAFEFANGHWHIRDLGSTNGTVVNGKPIDEHRLEEEATIVLYPNAPALVVKPATVESGRDTVFSKSVQK